MKMTREELESLKKEGASVRVRKTLPSEPVKSDPDPKPAIDVVPYAAMAASLAMIEANAEATQKLIAHNSAVIQKFSEDLKSVVSKKPKQITSKIIRDPKTGYMESVVTVPEY